MNPYPGENLPNALERRTSSYDVSPQTRDTTQQQYIFVNGVEFAEGWDHFSLVDSSGTGWLRITN